MAVPGDYHSLYDRDVHGAPAQPMPAPAGRHEAGPRRLETAVPELVVAYDEATGMPTQVTTQAAGARLAPAAATAEAAATGFVGSRADLWELGPEDVGTVEVLSVSRHGLRTVRLLQRAGGVEVFNSDVTMAVTNDNEVLAVAGQFFPGAGVVAARARALTDADAAPAIARAAADLTGAAYDAAEFEPTGPAGEGPYRAYQHRSRAGDQRPVMERPARVKAVLFPLGDGEFQTGFYLELWFHGLPPFSYVIGSGEPPDLLYRKNLHANDSFTYLVHNSGDGLSRPLDSPAPGTPHPTGTPDGFQAPPVSELAVTLESLNGDPWLAQGATTTQGNNCTAYADLTAPDGSGQGDVSGVVTTPRRFGQSYDHASSATDPGNLQNSIVGMFFHVNWLHDRWYAAGFDEAAGNGQQDNLGRGGAGGDPVLAEANDFSGTVNANMSTPADGDSPRMQMFLFTDPDPDRTSNHEALITFHEMGHYLTNRLVGNANGLTNQQGRAMGEGWGDFFALSMTSQPGDDFTGGCFAWGGWCVLQLFGSLQDNYYFGLRRYPYSALPSKNPLTFQHISSGTALPAGPPISPVGWENSGNNEVHNAGEVWCSALWEVFVNLVERHGHTHGERRMLHYVIGGLELTPNAPTFVQARDGIIAAVTAIDGTDLRPVWNGFAKRGMGSGAVAPSSTSFDLTGVQESFTIPGGLPDDERIAVLCAIDQLL